MSKFQLLRGAVFTPPDRFRLQLLLKRKGPPGRSTLSIAGRSKPFADFLGVTPSRAKQNRAAGGGGEPLCRTAKEGLIPSAQKHELLLQWGGTLLKENQSKLPYIYGSIQRTRLFITVFCLDLLLLAVAISLARQESHRSSPPPT